MSTPRKMIGAHTPKKVGVFCRRSRLKESSRIVNAAFDKWAANSGRTHLVYHRSAFGQPAS